MFEQKIENALNQQVNVELWASYLYLSVSYDMDNKGYKGFATWFSLQAEKEFKHATRIMKYIGERGGKVMLMPIEKVKQEWISPKEAFEDTLAQEIEVTKMINDLMDMAIELKDYASQNLLEWFVNEQLEEEDTPRKILEKLNRIEGIPAALYALDGQLGKRGSN